MTFFELLIFTLITGIVSGLISAYIVKVIDNKRRKNDRHSPKHGH